MDKKILVLGGAGYIGSHTVLELVRGGARVAVADNLQTGHRAAVDPAADFYEGDIRDEGFVDQLLRDVRPDGVIHFAACSVVGESMREPLKYYDNNLCGTKTLLEGLVRHGVDNVVFSSTAAVYGEPERIPIAESDATEPTNTYGETKLAMERMFRWVHAAHGLRYVPLRYFNACGADESGRLGEDHEPETHLIPIVLQAAAGKRASIGIFGDDYDTRDGTCVRDYIHVTDLAQAHILALSYLMDGGKCDVFNLGNGVGFTVKEVITAAEEVVGAPIHATVQPRRAGDPARLVASSDKARRVLGWQPKHAELRDIISSAWRWHSGHPNGYNG